MRLERGIIIIRSRLSAFFVYVSDLSSVQASRMDLTASLGFEETTETYISFYTRHFFLINTPFEYFKSMALDIFLSTLFQARISTTRPKLRPLNFTVPESQSRPDSVTEALLAMPTNSMCC